MFHKTKNSVAYRAQYAALKQLSNLNASYVRKVQCHIETKIYGHYMLTKNRMYFTSYN